MRVLPAGPFGLLLEFADAEATQRCFGYVIRLREAEASRFAAVVDVVPAERTVLLIATFDVAGQKALRDLVAALESPRDGFDADAPSGAGPGFGAIVELPVRYDGPDLAEVASLTRLGEADVVAAHTSTEFTVAFTGFAPGFAYLRGLPEALHVPRRAEPRTRVETGSVGLAGPYSGIYPRASPGGWQLIGRLDSEAPPLWDSGRAEPALLRPGMRVRFREAR
jgi:KipI family sensor histidine kinase inhibitor